MGIVQEKFQVTVPQSGDGDHGWVSDKSARVKKSLPGREGRAGGDHASKAMNNALFVHSLPPGMDIEDQELTDIRKQQTHLAGEGDVSGDTNRSALRKGFTRRDMRPTDDEFSRQHNDAFYDECSVDGVTGYLERNNVLDRL